MWVDVYRDLWWDEYPVGIKTMESETGNCFEKTVHGWKNHYGQIVDGPGNSDKMLLEIVDKG
ncbi:MAG: hypothetical protein WC679_01260 [Bacteroidales bacterium]|jgi:hypothetical protein